MGRTRLLFKYNFLKITTHKNISVQKQNNKKNTNEK